MKSVPFFMKILCYAVMIKSINYSKSMYQSPRLLLCASVFKQQLQQQPPQQKQSPFLLHRYRRMYGQNESLWRQILEVWSEVSRLFCEGVIEAKKMEAIMESEDAHGSFDAFRHTVQFSTMLRACDDVMKKRFSADLHVQVGRLNCTRVAE